jgi:hypothetical protein
MTPRFVNNNLPHIEREPLACSGSRIKRKGNEENAA